MSSTLSDNERLSALEKRFSLIETANVALKNDNIELKGDMAKIRIILVSMKYIYSVPPFFFFS